MYKILLMPILQLIFAVRSLQFLNPDQFLVWKTQVFSLNYHFRDRLPPTMTLCDRIQSPLDDHLVVKLNSIDRQMHKKIHSSHHAAVFFQTQRRCPLIFTLVWLILDLLLKQSGLHPPQALCCASFAFLSTLSRLLEIVPVKEWQKNRRPGIFPYNLP